jgi:hypothetical protein
MMQRMSVLASSRNNAKSIGARFQQLLELYAIERFLCERFSRFGLYSGDKERSRERIRTVRAGMSRMGVAILI